MDFNVTNGRKHLDCLLVGHNEMEFSEYHKNVSHMGNNSGALRDLRLNYVSYGGYEYTATNLAEIAFEKKGMKLNLASTFSATIAYIGTYLYRHGVSYDYIRSFQSEKEKLKQLLENCNITVIAITTTLYVASWPITEILEFIRKYNKSAKIVIGGPYVSTCVRTLDEDTLQFSFENLNADYFIDSSQGEMSLCKLINILKNGGNIGEVSNLYYKSGEEYVHTSKERENNNLDDNYVDWELFKNDDLQCCAIRTSISCPFNCAFCGFPQHAGEYQTALCQTVEKEIECLSKIGKTKSIHFIDDTFNVPKPRFKELLNIMCRNELKWHSYLRCQYMDEETADLMLKAGCEGVFLGVESGSPQILRNMNKNASVDDYKKGIELLKDRGIKVFASFIVGFPGETHQTIEETLEFISLTKPDYYRAQIWYCEPITSIWNQREKYGIKRTGFRWQHNTMSAIEACDYVDKFVRDIHTSLWIPQYNFDFDTLFVMHHYGISWDKINQFLALFQRCLVEQTMSRDTGAQISKETFTQFSKIY